ncbi:hypothetical protein [Brachyspira pulli]|uniref:hypothetical protein n=1 Tax=Brachyspira pulli TaxID=310721 RepID=UPI003007D8FB
MIKKVLLILSVMLFAFSCSSPSNPSGSTGDGGTTGGGTGTTDPSKISAFLKDKTGVYGNIGDTIQNQNELKIKDSNLYLIDVETWKPFTGTVTLYENESKIVIKNDYYMYTYTFGNKITANNYPILKKTAYQADPSAHKLGTVEAFSKFAGNYLLEDSLYIQIDNLGNVYFMESAPFKVTSENNTLVLSVDNQSYKIDLSQSELLLKTFIDGKELINDMEKSELLEKYEGTYTDGGSSLNIDKDGHITTTFNTAIKALNCRLKGNVITSTIYGQTGKEIYTFTFSGDGNTVTYKPHQGLESTLTKQN